MIEEKPYIGITGITTKHEAETVMEAFNTHLPQSTHQGMIGYLVSRRTLYGEEERSRKYPPVGSLPLLMSTALGNDRVVNTIHYKTNDQATLAEQLKKLLLDQELYSKNLCRAVQFNLSWPDITQLDQLKTAFPDLTIILRIGFRILANETYVDIANKATSYANYLNYVLLDPSGGTAQPFDAHVLTPLYRAIRHHLPEIPIILAGGFNPHNITPRLRELETILRHRKFGIDSEGGLRVVSRQTHNDFLSPSRVKTYIEKATNFFKFSND